MLYKTTPAQWTMPQSALELLRTPQLHLPIVGIFPSMDDLQGRTNSVEKTHHNCRVLRGQV